MDRLIRFALSRTAKTSELSERQQDKLLIRILLLALQNYMKKYEKLKKSLKQ